MYINLLWVFFSIARVGPLGASVADADPMTSSDRARLRRVTRGDTMSPQIETVLGAWLGSSDHLVRSIRECTYTETNLRRHGEPVASHTTLLILRPTRPGHSPATGWVTLRLSASAQSDEALVLSRATANSRVHSILRHGSSRPAASSSSRRPPGQWKDRRIRGRERLFFFIWAALSAAQVVCLACS
ncbi:hypothetical protein L209DRAFT_598255 [Thermothelomyces heterothallicus CBS 203.75]